MGRALAPAQPPRPVCRVPYEDLGEDYFDRRGDRNRRTRTLQRRLENLGYSVTITTVA